MSALEIHSDEEVELIQKIHTKLPLELWQEYAALVARRRAETLTAPEYDRLVYLTHQTETWNADRLKHIVALAQMRCQHPREIMRELGISLPDPA